MHRYRTLTRQPPNPGIIDFDNPIAKGLIYAIHFGDAGGIDVLGAPGVITDAGTISKSRYFGMHGIIGGGSATRSVTQPSNTMAILTGPVTHAGIIRVFSMADGGCMFSISDSSNNACFSIGRVGTNNLRVLRSNGLVWTYNGGGTPYPDISTGFPVFWAATSDDADSGTTNIWLYTSKYTTSLTGSGAATTSGAIARFLSSRSGGTTNACNGAIYLHYCWNRVLADWEIRSLNANRWQLFASLQFQIWLRGTGTWKTTLGVPVGSIKTVDGLAKANIKTNQGLTP